METVNIDKEILRYTYLGDIHGGSSYALSTEGIVSKSGTTLSLSPEQQWLLKNFKEDLNKIGYTDIMVFLGDGAEGKQVKIFSNTLMDADCDTHIEIGVKVLSLAIDKLRPKIYISVPGTDYHVQGYGNLDYLIFQQLKLKYPKIQFIGDFKTGVLDIKVNDLIHNYAHAYPTSRNALPPIEQIARDMTWNCKIAGKPVPNLLGRGHIHMHTAGLPRPNVPFGFTIPCQQLKTPYMSQRPYLTVREPDIGILTGEQQGKFFRLLYLSPFHYI